jgi:capsular exopolysaccharide synthesis family protein
MRNPRQHLLFGLQGGAGLSSVLSGRCSTNDALVTLLPFDNLTILCAGAIPPNPQELLSQVAFSYLLETAPSAFDIVIVDTPPILEYADAQLIANHAGACLYVTRRDKTTLADIAQAKLQLGRTRTEIIGAVAWA